MTNKISNTQRQVKRIFKAGCGIEAEAFHRVDNACFNESPDLRILGNTEVNIRDNYLYADSYIDLVTLDLNDPAKPEIDNVLRGVDCQDVIAREQNYS